MKTNGEIIADALIQAYAGELISPTTLALMNGWLRDHIRRNDLEVRLMPGHLVPSLIGTTPQACTWLELPHLMVVEPVLTVWPQVHRNGGS